VHYFVAFRPSSGIDRALMGQAQQTIRPWLHVASVNAQTLPSLSSPSPVLDPEHRSVPRRHLLESRQHAPRPPDGDGDGDASSTDARAGVPQRYWRTLWIEISIGSPGRVVLHGICGRRDVSSHRFLFRWFHGRHAGLVQPHIIRARILHSRASLQCFGSLRS
jgi:hypothetical protein